jgi:hypothetical protein
MSLEAQWAKYRYRSFALDQLRTNYALEFIPGLIESNPLKRIKH